LKQKSEVIYYILLSIVAVFLILVMVYFGASKTVTIDFYDRLLVGGLFILCCLFGISLAFYPSWYKKILKNSRNNLNKKNNKKVSRKRKGHHPDCSRFKNHVIELNDKVLCTGCLGLAIGSIISVFLMLIYLAFASGKTSTVFYLLIFLGLIMIAFNFVEIMFPIRQRFVHIFSNVFIVVGFLLIVIGVFEITKSKTYVIISIVFSFLWLFTRIQLSHRRHSLICSSCSKKCKMY
jgi:hypothetical protein